MVGTHSIVDFKLSLTKRVQWRGAQLEVVQADYLVRSYVRSLAAGAQVVM